MTQYGEPWRWDVDDNHKEDLAYLMSASGCVLSTAQDYELCPSKEDAARIVACVNACAGIPNSELIEVAMGEKCFFTGAPPKGYRKNMPISLHDWSKPI